MLRCSRSCQMRSFCLSVFFLGMMSSYRFGVPHIFFRYSRSLLLARS